MNRKLAIFVIAGSGMVATAPAWAGDDPIAELAGISGLSERRVAMVLGTRTAYAEYPYTYHRAHKRLADAIGQDNVQRLMEGKEITVRDREGRAVAIQLAPRTR